MPERPAVGDALRTAAARFGTPVFVTDEAALDAAAAAVRAAFPDPWIRQYSVKANDVAGIVALVAARGFGANVVSAGEWAVARVAGVPNSRVTLEGIGKSDRDLRAALGAGAAGDPLLWVAVESLDEAERLAELAAAAHATRAPIDVLFRLNPDVSPETHRGLAVGAGASKFGMTADELTHAVDAIRAGRRAGRLTPRGVHLHVGSQLGAVDAWRDGVRRALATLALVRGSVPSFDTLDVGGGFPVRPHGEPAPDPARFARELPRLLEAVPADRRPVRLAIEPGRFLVARSGWLVARVLHARERGGPLVVVDAGMTELIRPALYGALHPIVALTSGGRAVGGDEPAIATRVEGPICESTDQLGEHDLPPLRRGDLVAIADAGAYGASLSSTYNGRPQAPQVLLAADGSLRLLRRRGPAAPSAGSRTLGV
jgi:diaminopimelate decarboxylase